MKSDVLASAVINGKLTAYYYEIRFYMKYLQFLLSMSIGKFILKKNKKFEFKISFRFNNIQVSSKSEGMLADVVEHETPLSLIEDSCNAAFSVARYYLQNSFEPSRANNPQTSNSTENNKATEETAYFSKLLFVPEK